MSTARVNWSTHLAKFLVIAITVRVFLPEQIIAARRRAATRRSRTWSMSFMTSSTPVMIA